MLLYSLTPLFGTTEEIKEEKRRATGGVYGSSLVFERLEIE